VLIFSAALFWWWGCEKPYAPENVPAFDNTAAVTSVEEWTPPDSTGAASLAYKISFSITHLLPQFRGTPILFNIYRSGENLVNPLLVGRLFDNLENAGKGAYTYFTQSGNVDTVAKNDSGFFYDAVNFNSFEKIRYGVSLTVGLQQTSGQADFAKGKEGKITFAKAVGGGVPNRLSIDMGALNTVENIVAIEGAFDTTGLKGIIFYRYSEILTLDSLGMLFYITRMRDSLGAGTNFPIGRSRLDSLGVDTDGAVTIKDFASFSRTWFFEYGRLGRVDTVLTSEFSTFGKYGMKGVPGSPVVTFEKTDTLVSGMGKKWAVISGIWDSLYSGQTWNPMSDDINIAPYVGQIALDEGKARTRKVDFSLKAKRICLLDENIPFKFNTFNDPSFGGQVSVWVATRSLNADFFDKSGEISNQEVEGAFPPGHPKTKFPDCIMETVAQSFPLGASGLVQGEIALFSSGYRISPLARMSVQEGVWSISDVVKAVKKSDEIPADLVRTVREGSLLGYRESNLDKFELDTLFRFETFTLIASNSRGAALSPGWHTVADSLETNPFGPDTFWRPEFFDSYEGVTYRNPFRFIPLNVPDARKGYKEFVIVAFTRGKYFGDPRVFLSTFSSDFSYVWDKMPPLIHWSKAFDPLTTTKYAPMAYRNDRVTNLSLLENIFDVYLTAVGSQVSQDEPGVGVRDAGHGSIVSVVLALHKVGGALRNRPRYRFKNLHRWHSC